MGANPFIFSPRDVAQRLRCEVYHAAMDPSEAERLRLAYEDRVRVLEADIAARHRELKILAEVASKVHGEDEVQAILDIALEEILSRLGLKTAWVFIGEEKDHKLQLAASRGVSPVYLEEIERDGLSECLCPEVFWSGHRMQARNTTQCPRMPDHRGGAQGAGGPRLHPAPLREAAAAAC